MLLISPVPWQSGQVWGEVPGFAPLPLHIGQVSQLGTSILVSLPKAASTKLISKLYLKLAPLWERVPLSLLRVLAPKKESKISPKSPKSENPPP